MTPSLSTQFNRALFALPLLAVALAAALAAGSPTTTVIVVDELPASASGAAATLPGDDPLALNLIAKLDCDAAGRPAEARDLARMPGDIGALAGRLRCAK